MRALLLVLTLAPSLALAGVSEVLEETAAWRAQRRTGPPEIPAKAYLEAEAGTPQAGTAAVDGSPARKGWGVAVLDHPVEIVWKTINDELALPELTPLSRSELLSGREHQAGRLVFHYLPLSIVTDRWWISRVSHNASLYAASGGRLWEMAWVDEIDLASIPAGELRDLAEAAHPLDFTRGAWLATDLGGGRTLLEYHSHADPGGALPAGALSRFAAGSILETISAVEVLSQRRKGATEGGFVRPDGTPLP